MDGTRIDAREKRPGVEQWQPASFRSSRAPQSSGATPAAASFSRGAASGVAAARGVESRGLGASRDDWWAAVRSLGDDEDESHAYNKGALAKRSEYDTHGRKGLEEALRGEPFAGMPASHEGADSLMAGDNLPAELIVPSSHPRGKALLLRMGWRLGMPLGNPVSRLRHRLEFESEPSAAAWETLESLWQVGMERHEATGHRTHGLGYTSARLGDELPSTSRAVIPGPTASGSNANAKLAMGDATGGLSSLRGGGSGVGSSGGGKGVRVTSSGVRGSSAAWNEAGIGEDDEDDIYEDSSHTRPHTHTQLALHDDVDMDGEADTHTDSRGMALPPHTHSTQLLDKDRASKRTAAATSILPGFTAAKPPGLHPSSSSANTLHFASGTILPPPPGYRPWHVFSEPMHARKSAQGTGASAATAPSTSTAAGISTAGSGGVWSPPLPPSAPGSHSTAAAGGGAREAAGEVVTAPEAASWAADRFVSGSSDGGGVDAGSSSRASRPLVATRVSHSWVPASLLLKRFNVADPLTPAERKAVDAAAQAKLAGQRAAREGVDTTTGDSRSALAGDTFTAAGSGRMAGLVTSVDARAMQSTDLAPLVRPKPPAALFAAIFGGP